MIERNLQISAFGALAEVTAFVTLLGNEWSAGTGAANDHGQ